MLQNNQIKSRRVLYIIYIMDNTETEIDMGTATVTNLIDKMTLEFLMNRNQYKKYVSKTDPTKHIENEKHLQKIWKYRGRISQLTDELLKNPEKLVTLDVNESFDRYVRTLVYYFEMKDLENQDTDVLFDDMNDEDIESIRISDNVKMEVETKMALIQNIDKKAVVESNKELSKSFWGKDRVVKQSSMLDYSLHKK